MQADMDREMFAPTEPSLAEMTQKAIDLLSQDRDGFFLMVEAVKLTGLIMQTIQFTM
jgi:alkaline phosphatase